MVRYANLRIRRESVPSLDQVDEARASVFFDRLRGVLDSGQFEKHDRMIDRLLDQGYASTDICSALIQLLKGGPAAKAAPAAAAPKPATAEGRPERIEAAEPEAREAEQPEPARISRTGKEQGMTTLFFNAGRKHLVTTAEIVGKIAGVTRLAAGALGAIDIHQRHALVDVASEHADLVMKKMTGIRIRGHALKVNLATTEDKARE